MAPLPGIEEFNKSIFRRKKEILIWTFLKKKNKNSFSTISGVKVQSNSRGEMKATG